MFLRKTVLLRYPRFFTPEPKLKQKIIEPMSIPTAVDLKYMTKMQLKVYSVKSLSNSYLSDSSLVINGETILDYVDEIYRGRRFYSSDFRTYSEFTDLETEDWLLLKQIIVHLVKCANSRPTRENLMELSNKIDNFLASGKNLNCGCP